MLGKPKYNYGDVVRFKFDGGVKEGVIAIIDRWGTFEDNSDVSYDIMNKEENILYKHFGEKFVIEKIGQIPREEIWVKQPQKSKEKTCQNCSKWYKNNHGGSKCMWNNKEVPNKDDYCSRFEEVTK